MPSNGGWTVAKSNLARVRNTEIGYEADEWGCSFGQSVIDIGRVQYLSVAHVGRAISGRV